MTSNPKWRPGSRLKTDPTAAKEEFERIHEERGLTAATLVDESRPEDAVCHDDFEWRDDVAAEEHRKSQARRMIRSLVIEVPQSDPAPIYYSIKGGNGEGHYEPIEVVVQNVDMYATALGALQEKVKWALRAANDLRRIATESREPEQLANSQKLYEAVASVSSVVAETSA